MWHCFSGWGEKDKGSSIPEKILILSFQKISFLFFIPTEKDSVPEEKINIAHNLKIKLLVP